MPPALTRTVAGLPAWVWGAALGGGLLIGLYLRHRSTAAADAAAGTDSAGADSGAQLDANGNPMDGTASGDTADLAGMGELPGQAYTGFQGGSPPAYPPPNARIDPALLKELRRLARQEKAEQQRERKRKKHHRGGGREGGSNSGGGRHRHPASHAALGSGVGGAGAGRDAGTHYPAGTTSGVVV